MGFSQLGVDLVRPLRKAPQRQLRDPDEIGESLDVALPGDVETIGDRSAEARSVQRTYGAGVRVDRTAVDRRPPAFAVDAEVRDKEMGVQVRVRGSAGPMDERRREQTARVDESSAAPDERRMALEIAERPFDGALVRLAHDAADLVRTEGVQHAHRFRGKKGSNGYI